MINFLNYYYNGQLMDQIKLEITEIQSYEKSILKGYDVAVFFNGIKLKHTIFNGCEVVPASRYDFANFDLFTCSCGVAGCAGFHTAVIQEKTSETVKWIFPNDNSYSVDKIEFEFNRPQFEQEFEKLRTKMLELEKNNMHLVTCIRDESDYAGSDVGENRFEVQNRLGETFNWYADRYEARQNFNTMLKEKFSNIYQKVFRFKYEGKVEDGSFDLSYLVCRSLNQWPEKKKEKAYLKKAKAAGKAIEKALCEKNYMSFMKMVHKSYESFITSEVKGNYKETMWCAFEFELYKLVKKEDFVLGKLEIIAN